MHPTHWTTDLASSLRLALISAIIALLAALPPTPSAPKRAADVMLLRFPDGAGPSQPQVLYGVVAQATPAPPPPACTVDFHCGGAVAASGVSGFPPNCVCTCNVNFAGTFCQRCKIGFHSEATKCNRCLDGFGPSFPNCTDTCTNLTSSCNGNAVGFTSAAAPNCVCDCKPGYNGTRCDRCATGYSGYPNCQADCTSVDVDCSGNALSVSGTTGNCLCNCKRGYTNATCNACAPGFTGSPPNCADSCDNPATSCWGRGVGFKVVDPPNNCVCDCIKGYAGQYCEQCAAGYSGWPNCRDNCSDPTVSCNGQGTLAAASGEFAPNCVCDCGAAFTGPTCDKCIVNRKNPPLCNDCADGFGPYPFCYDLCEIISVSCVGPATKVEKNSQGDCVCTCEKGYQGNTCDQCLAGFSRDATTGKCVDRCEDPAITCSGNAVALTKDGSGGCVCTCKPAFAGAACDRCAYGFGTNYPNCVDNCTNPDASCTAAGRAFAVFDAGAGVCVCNCTARFQGRRCDLCAPGYTQGGPNVCDDDCTDPQISCNGRHRTMSLDESGCHCDCQFGWGGEKCERCAVGYTGETCNRCLDGFAGYPNCIDDCTNVTSSCNGNADLVGGTSTVGVCKCQCKAGWAGDRCDRCDRGYEGDNCDVCSIGFGTDGAGKCIDKCFNRGISCNNRAYRVEQEPTRAPGNCTCYCNTGWDGLRCDRCAPSFRGATCEECEVGYFPPQCLDACTHVSVSCNGHAEPAALMREAGVCKCSPCHTGFAGDKCDRCATGYTNYPTCHDSCEDPLISCKNNASKVTGVFPNCVCTCRHPFAGRLCTECVLGFTGVNCDQCATGFYPHPTLRCKDNCTSVNISCSGRAHDVAQPADVNAQCLCNCTEGFAGSRCERCAPNYAGWPNCVPACTNDFCNGRAVEIKGNYPTCTCVCQDLFEGSRCERCRKQYAGANCGQCANGYTGYPSCIDDCTETSVSCQGPATAVRQASAGFCVCDCKKGFAGATCSGCALGYEDWPYCTDSCTVLHVSCNATNTVAVGGKSPFCTCTCRDNFGGQRCDRCAYGFTGPNCSQCATGFDFGGATFPGCTDGCLDVAISCNNRAFGLSGGPGAGCNCDCIDRFNGSARCDVCRRGLTGETCNECLPGFVNYPDCIETCSVPATSCNGHGLSVTGSYPDCRCTCKHGWAGTRCDVCARGFTGASCTKCDVGFENQPNCTDACNNVTVSCNNRAYSVSKNPSDGTCRCECFPNYALPNCNTCYRSYTGPNCDQCAPGFENTRTSPGLPNCVDACSDPKVSCNGLGVQVKKLPSGDCSCEGFCPFRYTGHRCEACLSGYSGYPNCTEDCTDPATSCNGRATAVNGTSPYCQCFCTKRFTGERCTNCAKGYNGTNCDTCADGYTGYPDCINDCTIPHLACNGQGSFVRGSPGNCICVCHKNYTGATCSMCNDGYHGYPNCTDGCTNDAVSCSGVGTIRNHSTASNCTCDCPPNYAGPRCERCAAGYSGVGCTDNCSRVAVSCNDNALSVSGTAPPCVCNCKHNFEGLTCNRCANGFSPYPTCYDECSDAAASCNGKATRVNQSAEGCVCDCHATFAGRQCERCAAGYEQYPNCTDACTNTSVSCNDNAIAVNKSSRADGTCNCTCRRGWSGARCDTCAQGFTGPNCDTCTVGYVTVSLLCDSCATGFTGYPQCRDACNIASVSCGTSGVRSVEQNPDPDPLNPCLCHCVRGYTGRRCERCAPGFLRDANTSLCVDQCISPATSCHSLASAVRNTTTPGLCECDCLSNADGPFCNECALGYTDFPVCRDNCSETAISCNGNAANVSKNLGGNSTLQTVTPSGCLCACLRGFAGPSCGECAPGFTGYPNCVDACTNVNVSCAAATNAVSVAPVDVFDPSAGCQCTCKSGYTGGCDRCADGYTDYPLCYDACTNGNVSCNGHSSHVSGPPQNCRCTCRPEYTGSKCDACAAGRINYPACEDNCTLTSVSCSSAATAVRHKTPAELAQAPPGASRCHCSCVAGYDGDRCDTCAEGYDGHPRCEPACNSIDLRCSGHASIVNGTFPACFCDCLPGYGGPACDRCASGYDGYPNCVDNCTVSEVTCPAGVALRTMYWPNCQCDCAQNFSGVRCDVCASGYHGFPDCFDDCSNVNVSCRRAATSVTPADPSAFPRHCVCDCAPQFGGDRCDRCASGYETYPQCVDACTHTSVSCRGPAHRVTGAAGQCQCDCADGFAGRLCDRCAEGFGGWPNCQTDCADVTTACGLGRAFTSWRDPAAVAAERFGHAHCRCDCRARFAGHNCSKCAHGYGGWPTCSEACTNVTVSCNGNARSVSRRDSDGSCACQCKRGFTGDRCDKCDLGFADYPTCRDTCTYVNISCTGPAGRVRPRNADGTGGCLCQCSVIYNGTTCDRCADGYAGFPSCPDNCTHVAVSCGPNGVAVQPHPDFAAALASGAADYADPGSFTGGQRCECACHRNYTGTPCTTCATGFDRRNLTAELSNNTASATVSATASTALPCVDSCSSVEVSCNGRADAVWRVPRTHPNATTDACLCVCRRGFAGSRCERCARGYGGWPNCVEDCTDNEVSCNGRALTMGGSNGQCTCGCRDGYAGARCESCARLYVGWPNCIVGTDYFSAPMLVRTSHSFIDNEALRSGKPRNQRVVEIEPRGDQFYTDSPEAAALGVEAHFFKNCVRVTVVPDDTENPFGLVAKLPEVWQPASVAGVTPTRLTLLLLDAPTLQVRDGGVDVHFGVAGKCMNQLVAPNNTVVLHVKPTPPSSAERSLASGMLGPSGGVASVLGGGAAAAGPQALGMLADMPCTSPRLASAVQPSTQWILSPFGHWYPQGSVMRPLGAVFFVMLIAALNAIAAIAIQCARPVRMPRGSAGGLWTRVLGGAFAHESAYRVAMPGIAVVSVKLYAIGGLFLCLRILPQAHASAGDKVGAAILAVALVAAIGKGLHWGWTQRGADSLASDSDGSGTSDDLSDSVDRAKNTSKNKNKKKPSSKEPGATEGVFSLAAKWGGSVRYITVDSVTGVPGGAVDADVGRSAVARAFLPGDDWWPLRRSTALLPLLSPVRSASYSFLDSAFLAVLLFIGMFTPSEPLGCTMQLASMALWCGITLLAMLLIRPFRTPAINVGFAGVVGGLGLTALGLAVEASLPGGFGTGTFVAGAATTQIFGLLAVVAVCGCLARDVWRAYQRARSPDADDDTVFEARRLDAKARAAEEAKRKVDAARRRARADRAQARGHAEDADRFAASPSPVRPSAADAEDTNMDLATVLLMDYDASGPVPLSNPLAAQPISQPYTDHHNAAGSPPFLPHSSRFQEPPPGTSPAPRLSVWSSSDDDF